jgi:hypothetical protein
MVTAKTGRPRRGGLVLAHFLTVRDVVLSAGFTPTSSAVR